MIQQRRNNRINAFRIGFILVFAIFSKASTGQVSEEQVASIVFKKANPSVVRVEVETNAGAQFLGDNSKYMNGSGVLLDAEGHIVTNLHVVSGANRAIVTFCDRKTAIADVIGRDENTDLAVLKLKEGKRKPLRGITLGSTSTLQVGEKIFLIGSPQELPNSLSVGYVSALDRDIPGLRNSFSTGGIQFDAAIYPGSSGGALLNSKAELIGVPTRMTSPSESPFGFAISIETVKRVIPELISKGYVERAALLAELKTMPSEYLEHIYSPIKQGVVILRMEKNSPLAQAGFRLPTKETRIAFRPYPLDGDLIYKVDGREILTDRDFLAYIDEKKIGDEINIHFVRDHQLMQKRLKLTVSDRASRKLATH